MFLWRLLEPELLSPKAFQRLDRSGRRCYLLRRMEEVRRLVALVQRVYHLKHESKFERLWEALAELPDTKVLVFTEFRDTLDFLIERLEGKGLTGRMPPSTAACPIWNARNRLPLRRPPRWRRRPGRHRGVILAGSVSADRATGAAAYPDAIRQRLTFDRAAAMPDLGREPEAIYLHPGEPVFDTVADLFLGHYEAEAMRGATFLDPEAVKPYLFYLARTTIHETRTAGNQRKRQTGGQQFVRFAQFVAKIPGRSTNTIPPTHLEQDHHEHCSRNLRSRSFR